ncbi:MAG: PAS domain-containing protein [Nostoc sp. NMS7]|uniref:PAS domain-containing protein n=1 Tax=Nostoc sp. NMS7 TaxID=2815391 RepID=UPI0025F5FEA4|nr:PAS domain-containing protein [Nostoc sp. NMS7]MBN3952047.1 PAS domain-containing protein [Nostoc sp. NMS7]
MSQRSRIVLIVDDSPEDRELYRQCLLRDREYSYTLLEATLGGQGLQFWQQHQPDIILLDYRLPDLDGLEFLAQLQPLIQQSSLPVIVITGQGNEAIAVQAMKAGAQDYIVKEQITPEGLRLAVNGAIEAVQLRIQLQQRIERERLVSHITQQIHQSLNLDEILQTTVTQVRQFLQTDRVLVFRLMPDGDGTVIAESVGEEWRSLLFSNMYDPCLAESYVRSNRPKTISYDPAFVENYIERYRQGYVTAIFDIQDSSIDPCHVELLAQFQVKANLVVPIIQDHQFWGLLIAHHCASPRFWQPLEIDLLKELAIQVSIALRQAELYQQAQNELADRRRIEAKLRQSEERLRLALSSSRMGTWNWNIQTGVISWSDNLEALFGLEPGEFDGSFEMFVARLHPDDRDRVLAAVNHAIATGEDYDIEFRVVYPNGNIRWALSQGKVFYDQHKQPIQMAGIDLDITERKRSAKALRDSEERFRQLAENIDAVFWIREVCENRVSYVSPAYKRLWGLDPQELYKNQQSWVNRIHPEDRESTDRAFQEKAAAGEFDQEYRIVFPDGGIRWVHDRCFPLRDQTGEIYRFAGIAEDISDRKQTEKALRENEQLLRLALAGAHAGSWDWEIPTNKIVWSSENFDLYGLDPANSLPEYEEWYNTLHPDDRQWVNAEVYRVVEERLPEFRAEFRIIHPQLGIRWLLGVGRLTLNKQGEPIRLSGINLDITDRKQAESALRQSEEFKRRILESSSDCIKLLDFDGRLLYMNMGGMCLLEMDDIAPYLNVEWTSFWQNGDRPTAEAAIATARAGELIRFQGFCPTAKGTPKWWDVAVTPILDTARNVLQILAISRDITERKQGEQERDRLLEQEQLARAEAERANRIKDEFFAILSHELRSPLNPILGWTRLLRTRKFDQIKTAEALATIERNVKLQTQLIDDLLDIAKILRGKLSMDAAPVNLTFVIESAIDTVKTAALSKSILLHPVLPNIGQVSGDSTRLQQIVWNLLSNAIKFTDNGGRVEIRLQRVDQQAHIIVSDTGKGINPDFLPDIFESFRQEDVSITRKYGGLGLGLAIVRQLVEAHGGTIAAESPGEGLGATFTVRLPLLNIEPEIKPIDKFPQQALNLTGIRVLAVDDDLDARELLTVLLVEYGAEVLTVASAAEVLVNLESFQPDVLVSDIGMPEVDGYTLIQQIRTLPPEKGGQILAIALTAYAREDDHQRAIASGYQRHVTKPLDPEELVEAVVVLAHSKLNHAIP